MLAPTDGALLDAVRLIEWVARKNAPHALLSGKLVIAPEDIRRLAHLVFRHRVLLNFAGEAEGISVEHVITQVLETVPVPASNIRR